MNWETKTPKEWKALLGTKAWDWRKKHVMLNFGGDSILAYSSACLQAEEEEGNNAHVGMDSMPRVTTH
eukprot:3420736-Pleurochrysis_carterae.AAC.1